jgi:antitoxin VapB
VARVLKTAKLFVNGGSQAVRLPAEFRFEHHNQVYIRRDTVTGDVILSSKPASHSWTDFFISRDLVQVPRNFMTERPLNYVLRPGASPEDG